MLLQTHGLGWSQPVVDVRQDPQLVAHFAALWSVAPEALASSADGLSVYLNTRDSKGGWHRPGIGDWLHWDQSPDDETPSVQGFVNLLPTAEHGAALQVLTKSHRRQAECDTQVTMRFAINDMLTRERNRSGDMSQNIIDHIVEWVNHWFIHRRRAAEQTPEINAFFCADPAHCWAAFVRDPSSGCI
jgi:hypothetical protein